MKKVLIVGSGGQGGPCASILARDKGVSEIVLEDIDIELASKVKNKIKSDKINTVKLDAGKIEELEGAAGGVDAIINLTLPRFDFELVVAQPQAEAALIGIHKSLAHHDGVYHHCLGPIFNIT